MSHIDCNGGTHSLRRQANSPPLLVNSPAVVFGRWRQIKYQKLVSASWCRLVLSESGISDLSFRRSDRSPQQLEKMQKWVGLGNLRLAEKFLDSGAYEIEFRHNYVTLFERFQMAIFKAFARVFLFLGQNFWMFNQQNYFFLFTFISTTCTNYLTVPVF